MKSNINNNMNGRLEKELRYCLERAKAYAQDISLATMDKPDVLESANEISNFISRAILLREMIYESERAEDDR